jgi:hypothetical protein
VRNSKTEKWLLVISIVVAVAIAAAWLGTLSSALASYFGYRELSVEADFPLSAFFSGGILRQVAFSILLYAPAFAMCFLLLRRTPLLTAAWLSCLYFLWVVTAGSSRWFAASTGVNGFWQYLVISSIPVAICFIVRSSRRTQMRQ